MILPLRKRKKGFSIVEVVVSALIFTIAAAGIITMTSRIRPQATVSEREVTAAIYAKQIFEWLRSKVSAADWDTGSLSNGTYWNVSVIGSTAYNAVYTISTDPLSGGRLINLTVRWDDPT
ncbi:MAG: prepilin-type N-terminal cleavage/methylation domain-containing protein [Candidatus Omnitrophota bacterium]